MEPVDPDGAYGAQWSPTEPTEPDGAKSPKLQPSLALGPLAHPLPAAGLRIRNSCRAINIILCTNLCNH